MVTNVHKSSKDTKEIKKKFKNFFSNFKNRFKVEVNFKMGMEMRIWSLERQNKNWHRNLCCLKLIKRFYKAITNVVCKICFVLFSGIIFFYLVLFRHFFIIIFIYIIPLQQHFVSWAPFRQISDRLHPIHFDKLLNNKKEHKQ